MKRYNVVLLLLNYNDYKTTIEFLLKVKEYNTISKIIVIDNKSTDKSLEELNKFVNDKIDVICTDKNGGYGYGNNFGAKYAEKKYNPNYFIISNPDVIVEEETIINILKCIEEEKNISIGTCKMLERDGTINDRFAWKLPTYKDNIILCFPIISRILKPTRYKKEILKDSKPILVDVIPGSFFIIKADTFKKINYFDERTFLFYEEEILAYKLKKLGEKSILVPYEQFIHNHGVSINKTYQNYLSRYKIMGKSKEIYLNNYLKVGKVKLGVFKIIFNYSKLEFAIIEKIKKLLRL